jgi:hypothetical protein
MEFENRKKCVEHYLGEYPNLPRYMIEMALDYDLAQGDGVSNEKPLTGKQKRKLKKAKQEHEPVERELNRTIQDALKSGKPLEIDCATIVRGDEYVMPPFVKGYIAMDGNDVMQATQEKSDCEIEEIEETCFNNEDF